MVEGDIYQGEVGVRIRWERLPQMVVQGAPPVSGGDVVVRWDRTLSTKSDFFLQTYCAGFNPEFADRLSEPFQRLHSQGEFVGTGIGLATVQRIISRHGGRVWTKGTVGEGATFYFALDV